MNPQRPPNQGIQGQTAGHPAQGSRPGQNGQQSGLSHNMAPMQSSVITYNLANPTNYQGNMNQHQINPPPTSIPSSPYPNTMQHSQPQYQRIPSNYSIRAQQPIMQQTHQFLSQRTSGLRPHYPSGQPQRMQGHQPSYTQSFTQGAGHQTYGNYRPQIPQPVTSTSPYYRTPMNQSMFNQSYPFPIQQTFAQRAAPPQAPPHVPNQSVGITGPSTHVPNVAGQQTMMNPEVPDYVPAGQTFQQQRPQFNAMANAYQPPTSTGMRKSYAIMIKDPLTGLAIDIDDNTPRSRQASESQRSDCSQKDHLPEQKVEPSSPPEKVEIVEVTNDASERKEVNQKNFLTNEMVTKAKSSKNRNTKKKKNSPKQSSDKKSVLTEQNGNGEINGNSIQDAVPTPVERVQVPEKPVEPIPENVPEVLDDDEGWELPKRRQKKKPERVNEKVQKPKELKKQVLKTEPTVTLEQKVEVQVEKVQVDDQTEIFLTPVETQPPEEVKPVAEDVPEPVVEEIEEVLVIENVPEYVPENVPEIVETPIEVEEPIEPECLPTEDATPESEKIEEEKPEEEDAEEDGEEGKSEPVKEYESLALTNRAKIDAGEKVAYDRDFLLQFQSACLVKPEELPDLDVILSQPTDAHRRAPVHERENKNHFVPQFVSNPRKAHPKTNSRHKNDRRPSNQSGIVLKLPSHSKNQKLRETENPYKRGLQGDMADEKMAIMKFQREAKNILNKLTPENEKKLTKQFTNLKPITYELLNIVVSTVFEKAIQEPHFSTLYAKLCKQCHEEWQNVHKFTKMDKNNVQKVKAFREVLLQKAQEKFEKLKILHIRDKSLFEEKSLEWKRIDLEVKMIEVLKEEEVDKRKQMELQEEIQDLNHRIKVQSMGNVTFVGELYLQKLLSVNIMIGCMRQLISSDYETELESLSKLIPTIGAELEKEQRGQDSLMKVFQQIEAVINAKQTLGDQKKTVSPRVICLLQDICDLRQRRWEKRQTAMQGPTERRKLHKEHEDREKELQSKVQEQWKERQARRTTENRGRKAQFESGHWQQNVTTTVLKQKFDPTKLASSSRSRDNSEQPTLGPQRKRGQITKNKSIGNSSDGTPSNSGRNTPEVNFARNKFDVLNDDENDMDKHMTKSHSFNRGPSEGMNRFNKHHNMSKNMTHDGRTSERKKLGPEEVARKTRLIINDFQEANGDTKLLEEACDEILKLGLLESTDYAPLMVKLLVDCVLEKQDENRLKMGKFFHIMADRLPNLQFERPLKMIVDTAIDEDFITDCPHFWSYFCMITAPIFKSPNVNPKIVVNIFAKAGDRECYCMQLTKAYVTLLEELTYCLKQRGDVHTFFQKSEIDLAAAMEKDGLTGTPEERLKQSKRDLGFLLKPLVVIEWKKVEDGLTQLLKEHDFSTDESTLNYEREFNYLESNVPDTAEGRGSVNFTKVIIRAVMNYSVSNDGDNFKMVESGDDLALTNCDVLLMKYLDDANKQLDALFILADLFQNYQNNQVVIKRTFVTMYEITVIDMSTFEKWKDNEKSKGLSNYPTITSATTGFYKAIDEIRGKPQKV